MCLAESLNGFEEAKLLLTKIGPTLDFVQNMQYLTKMFACMVTIVLRKKKAMCLLSSEASYVEITKYLKLLKLQHVRWA